MNEIIEAEFATGFALDLLVAAVLSPVVVLYNGTLRVDGKNAPMMS